MLARSLLLSCLLALEAPAQGLLPIPPYNLGLPSGCTVIDYNGQPAIVIMAQYQQSIATFYTPNLGYKMLALRFEAIMVVDYRPAAQGLSWDINEGDNHQASNRLPPSGVDLIVPYGAIYEFAGWGGWSMYANFTNSYCKLGAGCPTPQAPQWTVAIATVIPR